MSQSSAAPRRPSGPWSGHGRFIGAAVLASAGFGLVVAVSGVAGAVAGPSVDAVLLVLMLVVAEIVCVCLGLVVGVAVGVPLARRSREWSLAARRRLLLLLSFLGPAPLLAAAVAASLLPDASPEWSGLLARLTAGWVVSSVVAWLVLRGGVSARGRSGVPTATPPMGTPAMGTPAVWTRATGGAGPVWTSRPVSSGDHDGDGDRP